MTAVTLGQLEVLGLLNAVHPVGMEHKRLDRAVAAELGDRGLLLTEPVGGQPWAFITKDGRAFIERNRPTRPPAMCPSCGAPIRPTGECACSD